ncbi:FUSC family protein [Pseudochrobactrum sp. HB0163]|uniref:FUSC family protein n=1 Tax=Pseudochrobactrum sp. HB0163 TaxID=3450708 RepID=UPI003F6E32C7
MATSADTTLRSALRETLADLAPFPGRAATAWRVAAVCALVTGFAMMFHIPEAAISCYLVIFLMKADGAENTLVATIAIIAISLMVALMIPVIQSSVESALVRIVVMIIVSFIFIFIGAASKLGEGGSIIALIIVFILTLVNDVPLNGVISLALRYAWEMAILPMFMIAGFSLFFGRWSLSLQREELRERLMIARNALQIPRPSQNQALQDRLEAGNDDSHKRFMLIKILHQTSKEKTAKIKADIAASYQLIFAASALPQTAPENSCQHYQEQIDAMVQALDNGTPLPQPAACAVPHQNNTVFNSILQALRNIAGAEQTAYAKGENDSFFAADAFTNPAYQRFALKTTLAAILCYMFYAAINWQGIHTAMVTCYVASLGTAGDTIHKLLLRISGCLIGAAIGAVSILYLLPHMETVSALMVLVFFTVLLAAWVAAGSNKISYAGVQIGLAFTLTVLQGFGPTTDMDTARDRIIGILVGNFAVYLISTLVWPTPVSETIRSNLSKALSKIAALAATPPEQRMEKIATISEIEQALGEVRYCFYLLPFEPASLRPTTDQQQAYRKYTDVLATLNREICFSAENMSDFSERLHILSQRILNKQPIAGTNPHSDNNQPASSQPDNLTPQIIAEQITELETMIADSKL